MGKHITHTGLIKGTNHFRDTRHQPLREISKINQGSPACIPIPTPIRLPCSPLIKSSDLCTLVLFYTRTGAPTRVVPRIDVFIDGAECAPGTGILVPFYSFLL